MRVVATAGHVDHGKSSLVLALTGTDPDRFPEEKTRGLTIDLGFAFTTTPAGEIVGFVDVPGHVRFVKNMLAGVGAVEVAMLVVAATEGWMPQTEEHTRILDLLGVAHGLVVLTKAALVDEETIELALLELEERVTDTHLARWPVVVADSLSGRGLGEVRLTLDAVLSTSPAAADRGRPRLWVDRVFSAKGSGTVVTGTLAGGSLSVGEEVLVEPGGRAARVRGLEIHHERVDSAAPGSRVALNLSGIEHGGVRRGDAIVRPGHWLVPAVVDVAFQAVPGESTPRRGPLVAHVGSGEHAARWRALDTAADTGRSAVGRLRLPYGLPLAPGDRLVLRSPARSATLGGAEVLDVVPARRAADALDRLALPLGRRVLSARHWLTVADLAPLAGAGEAEAGEIARTLVETGAAERAGSWIVETSTLASVRDGATARVLAHHKEHPLDRGLDLAELASSSGLDTPRLRAALSGSHDLLIERDYVSHKAHRTSVLDDPEARRLLDALESSPFSPPSPADVGATPAVTRALLKSGLAMDLGGVVFSAGAVAQARRIVGGAVLERGSVTIADLRDLLGSTRKFVLPLANHLDYEGVTRRRGDDRIPGPRAGFTPGSEGPAVTEDRPST